MRFKNINNNVFLFFLILTLLCISENVFTIKNNEISPNNDHPNNLFWIKAGLGVGGSKQHDGIAFGANLSYQKDYHLFSVRSVAYIWQIGMFSSPGGGFIDAGVLYGRVAKKKYGFASLSGGLAVAKGNPNSENITTLGLPLETQLFFTPFSFLGLGITGFANINPEESFYGGLICIQIGKLR